MKTLHVEGSGWLHRLSPRIKLVSLALFSVALFATRQPAMLIAALAGAAFVVSQARLGLRETLTRLSPVLLTVAVIALFSFAFASPREAVVTLLRLSALALLATAVTASVSISQFMDEIAAILHPLERVGLARTADMALAVGLVLRFVPDIANRYRAIRDAHLARGLKIRLHRVLAPLIIMTLKDADTIADAIDARGFRGQTSDVGNSGARDIRCSCLED